MYSHLTHNVLTLFDAELRSAILKETNPCTGRDFPVQEARDCEQIRSKEANISSPESKNGARNKQKPEYVCPYTSS
jgi:hypothetical protein